MKRGNTGVYQIVSCINNKLYIGSTVDFKTRKKQHIYSLIQSTHNNSHLQNHVNKYGISDLKFKMIEYCKKEELLIREQFYLDTAQPDFNICTIATSRLGVKASKETIEKIKKGAKRGKDNPSSRQSVKDKISKANTGKVRTTETKAQISASVKEWNKTHVNPFKGKQHSEEAKNRMSLKTKGRVAWNKGIPCAKETKEKLSNFHKGKVISKETRAKISESLKGIVVSDSTRKKLSIAAKKRWASKELKII